MAESEAGLPEVHVQPGESLLVHDPTILRTILGSCVGVSFRVQRLGIGALCHPMMPRCPAGLAGRADGRRYVDYAIRELAGRLDSLGARRSEIEVKLFGGGDVLQVSNGSVRPTVGRQNGEAALDVLRREGFELAASSLGGKSGLNIKFNTATGEVLLRRLS